MFAKGCFTKGIMQGKDKKLLQWSYPFKGAAEVGPKISSFVSLKTNLLQYLSKPIPFPLSFWHLHFEPCTNVIVGSWKPVHAVLLIIHYCW